MKAIKHLQTVAKVKQMPSLESQDKSLLADLTHNSDYEQADWVVDWLFDIYDIQRHIKKDLLDDRYSKMMENTMKKLKVAQWWVEYKVKPMLIHGYQPQSMEEIYKYRPGTTDDWADLE